MCDVYEDEEQVSALKKKQWEKFFRLFKRRKYRGNYILQAAVAAGIVTHIRSGNTIYLKKMKCKLVIILFNFKRHYRQI